MKCEDGLCVLNLRYNKGQRIKEYNRRFISKLHKLFIKLFIPLEALKGMPGGVLAPPDSKYIEY